MTTTTYVRADEITEGDLVRVPGPINGSINGSILRVGAVQRDYLPGVFSEPAVRWSYVDPTTGEPSCNSSKTRHTDTQLGSMPIERIDQ